MLVDQRTVRLGPGDGSAGVVAACGTDPGVVQVRRFSFDDVGLLPDHRVDEVLRFDVAVSVAQLTQVCGLVGDRHVSERLDAPAPCHVAQVIEWLAWAASGPVDEGDGQAVLTDGVEWAGVAVDDTVLITREGMAGGCLMQLAKHHSGTRIRSLGPPRGMVGRLAHEPTSPQPATATPMMIEMATAAHCPRLPTRVCANRGSTSVQPLENVADADAGIARLARYWADDLAVGGKPMLWWHPEDAAAPIRDWLHSDALHERLSRMDALIAVASGRLV